MQFHRAKRAESIETWVLRSTVSPEELDSRIESSASEDLAS